MCSSDLQPTAFKRAGEYTKAEIDAMAPGKMKEDLTAARIDADKRYLRRDRPVTDEYKQQLELRIKELMEWGVEIGDKGKQKLTEAGIIVPGVNDDMVEEEAVSVEKVSVDSADSVDKMGEAKQAVLGLDENPMDGVELHKGEKETEE